MIFAIISSVISFVSTNIDDILILMVLFSKADSREKRKHVFIGQYIGIGFLVLISILGALGLSIVQEKYIGFLGLVPMFMGIKELYEYKKGKEDDIEIVETDDEVKGASALNFIKKYIPSDVVKVFMISIANGADNIGIYIPMFRVMTTMELVVTIIIFILMIYIWCIVAIKLVNYPLIKRNLEKYKDILVPVVFIIIGVFIFVESFRF